MKIIFPQSGDSTKKIEIENIQKFVIIGKNGSGKSRLAKEIERLNPQSHRITAQKILVIPDTIPLKSKKVAENEFLYGSSDNQNQSVEWRKKNYRWRNTTLNDYTQVLSLLFMKENERNAQYVDEMKNSTTKLEIPMSEVDKIKDIWKQVFPQRDISLFAASVNAKYGELQYSGQEMSDGEKVGLYLMAECLCVPQNFLIIIDEPELHLHRSIFNRLWEAIEKMRDDCAFIYVTHDFSFAAKRRNAKYLTVEKFDGKNWYYNEQFLSSEVPNDVIEDLLGAKEKILFIEGTGTSYDAALYNAIFPNIHVISCGGCTEVIRCVRAQKKYTEFTHVHAYGLIDRDFRPECEIDALETDDIFVVELAEIENFFIVPELLLLMIKRLGIVPPEDYEKCLAQLIQQISEIYAGQIESQIQKATETEIIYQLSKMIKSDFAKFCTSGKEYIDEVMLKVKPEVQDKFFNAKNKYLKILTVFNFKATMGERNITNAITSLLCINGSYKERVVQLLYDDAFRMEAVCAWKKYIPKKLLSLLDIA